MGIIESLFGKKEQESYSGGGIPPIQDISEQTPDEQRLIAYVTNRIEESRQSGSRITHEGIWMTNIAYLLGFDSVFYDTTTRQFKTMGQRRGSLPRNRIHVNKVLPTIQNRLSRLCKNPPKYDVRPGSNSTEDKDAARLSMQILTMYWDKQKLNAKRIPLYMWMQQCGHAYLKICWDDQAGQPMPGEDGKLSYSGDIRCDIVSPFEVFPDPVAKSFDELGWLVHAKVRKLDYFKCQYPERGHLVKEDGAWLLSLQYEARINSLSTSGPGTTGTSDQAKDSAIEMVYYEKRSKDHPEGRMVICANGVLLEDKELPVGEFPFAKFDDCIVAGKYYSESVITHLRPIQDQYNRVIAKRAEWTNRLLAGKYVAVKGSGLTQESMNDQSGEVVYYDPVPNGAPPMTMNIPVIPQYAYVEEDRLEKMMYDISGINEVSRGQLPSASVPALGMQLLAEQDDTRIGVITESNEESWAHIGKLILLNVEKFCEMPQLLKISGNNREYEVKEFKGADIRNNNDVIVKRGSTLPGSKVLDRQSIINYWQLGLAGNPQDPNVREKIAGAIEFGETDELWTDRSLDMNQVKKDMEDIESGIVPVVSEYDNHVIHLIEKNRFRKGDKFLALDPQKQMILVNNIEEHIKFLVDIQNPQIQQNMKIAAAQEQSADAMQSQVDQMTGLPQGGPLQ